MLTLTAPVQGHTDAPWRHWHHATYKTDTTYFTPFIRWEKDGVRQRDTRDLDAGLDEPLPVVPQVIFKNTDELGGLLDFLSSKGCSRVDINIGCPFPLQTSAGRGAAMIANTAVLGELPEILSRYPDIVFSMKMRLGMSDPDEWRLAMPVINSLRLSYVTLHPRVARQQYGGEVDLERFGQFIKESRNPVIYNGDLHTPGEIAAIVDRFPEVAGVMTGRGLLGRPSLLTEFAEGGEWSHGQRLERMMTFHDKLYDQYRETLCGDSQVLSKIKPFWEYAETEIGRKAWKAIKKATTIPKYETAVAMIL